MIKQVKVSDFAEVITGGTPSTTVDEYWDGGTIPWLNSGELNKKYIYDANNFITEVGLKRSSTRLMPAETVLIALTGATCGLSALMKIEACANQSVTGILPSEKHSSDYLFHYLKTQRERILDKAWGNAQPHISQKFVKDMMIPLPSLPDQLHIANLLSKAENLINHRKESIRLLDEFLKSTFSNLFDNPVTNRKKFKIVKLKKLITFLTSGGRGWGKYYSEKGDRFIRSLDVQTNYISNEDAAFVNPPNNKESIRTKVKPFDVLLTITGSKIGRVAMVPIDFGIAYVSQHVAIIRTRNINQLYLSYYLNDINCGQYLIQKSFYGQTKPGLNFKQIENFEIIVPPFERQTQFVQIVEKTEALKTQYQKSLHELENLYGSLSQKAFRGELNLKDESLLMAAESEAKYITKQN